VKEKQKSSMKNKKHQEFRISKPVLQEILKGIIHENKKISATRKTWLRLNLSI
jgi:hypothetical protein